MPDTATCSQCGINFEVNVNEKEIRRAPCPNCGSDARNIKIHTRETLHVLASVHVSLNEVFSGDFAPKLLLQTVIIQEIKT